jgi:hypothetical protein
MLSCGCRRNNATATKVTPWSSASLDVSDTFRSAAMHPFVSWRVLGLSFGYENTEKGACSCVSKMLASVDSRVDEYRESPELIA